MSLLQKKQTDCSQPLSAPDVGLLGSEPQFKLSVRFIHKLGFLASLYKLDETGPDPAPSQGSN